MDKNKKPVYKYIGFEKYGKYGHYKVTDYVGNGRYSVVFTGTGYETTSIPKHIASGTIKDLYFPSVCGVGFIGKGDYFCKDPEDTRWNTLEYEVWRGVMRRCYHNNKNNISWKGYGGKGVVVSPEWHCFQDFAKWYTSQPQYKFKWHLDKDLVNFRTNEYAKDNCTLVPPAVNSLFTGGFKTIVHCQKGRWVAQLQRGEKCNNGNKRQSYLGKFGTKQEALEAFFSAKIEHVAKVANEHKEHLDERVYTNLTNPTWVREYINYLSEQNNQTSLNDVKGEK